MSCIVSDCDAVSAENALVYYDLDEEFQTVALPGTHRFWLCLVGHTYLSYFYVEKVLVWHLGSTVTETPHLCPGPFLFSLKCDRTCPGCILVFGFCYSSIHFFS